MPGGPDNGPAEERPRIPPPRAAAEDRGPLPDPEPAMPPPAEPVPGQTPQPVPPEPEAPVRTGPPVIPLNHKVLKSLLGAWALSACSVEETAAVEAHLTDCAMCADEAVRLRDAVGLLHKEDNLDLDPMLRSRTLAGCLERRPARIPVPEWAAPYDAETARLDALLNDMGESEWRTPVRLRWYEGSRGVEREATVAGVLGHLMAVDGTAAVALGLPDPLAGLGEFAGPGTPPESPASRTEAYWRSQMPEPPGSVRDLWRDQARSMVRTVGFAGGPAAEQHVPYGEFGLPLRDSFLDRAFECWMHAWDIAEAVDYPYGPPAAPHLHLMIDLAVRLLPEALAGRRRAGLAGPVRRLGAAGKPGRTLHLEVEGKGGGHWYIPLDSPGAVATPEEEVARVALDATEFCQLAAGHILPEDAAAGQEGDREAIREVLSAAAALSRL
ncbi:maleylpyruvate isomerase family mycothiol-dependent enzyme [Streptomyces sp. NPDC051776]|uniref:maleylpyruvate isomerase family mycothiol-dependent enzyme n=1 Tax=Streptomyces sp. NPDC051776 TaxID=3155414 RepID=UPI00343C1A6A